MEEITLNLIPSGVRPTCHVSQNDNERDIKINLVEGSLAYAIKSGDVVKLNIRKPNDVVISSRITATVGNTYVIANIKDEMCNVDGTNLCEIRIINGDTRISTSNFLMEVEVDPSANGGGGGGGASNLADLDDVNISEPSNGQVLKYNGTSEMWENGTGGGGGASAMSDLTDVDLTGLEDGNSLVYDDDDDEWKVQTITKEVTQAEYDALVQAGTVDPKTAYFIKDTNGDGQDFQPVIYSLEEREIGVWTDGKPLYEKTIARTFSGDEAYTVFASGIDIAFIQSCFFEYTSGSSRWMSPYYISSASTANNISINSDVSSGALTLVNQTRSSKYFVVTVRYTKTADQAGSGTWTPQGIPTHHYSTDEQIVGTWVDGSTIYERTFDKSSSSWADKGWTNNILGTSGIVIRNVQGYLKAFSGTVLPFNYFRSATEYFTWLLNADQSDINVRPNLDTNDVWGDYITIQYTKVSS